MGLGSRKDVPIHCVPVSATLCRLAGAGGRKKIFRLSDVLKPLTDAQVEAMKLGAVKRILRAEKAVACSGAAQVCPCPPSLTFQSSSQELAFLPVKRRAPTSDLSGSRAQLCRSPAAGPWASPFSKPHSVLPMTRRRWRQLHTAAEEAEVGGRACTLSQHTARCKEQPREWGLLLGSLFLVVDVII